MQDEMAFFREIVPRSAENYVFNPFNHTQPELLTMACAVVLAVIAYNVPHALFTVSFASVNPFLHSYLKISLNKCAYQCDTVVKHLVCNNINHTISCFHSVHNDMS